MLPRPRHLRLSEDDFLALVDEALDSIPPQFEPYMEGLSVEVQPMPTREVLDAVGLSDPRSLLGYYHGVPLPDRSVSHSLTMPDVIIIYQRNIERICRTRAQAVRQIRKTVLHEVGHHFGMDEDELDNLGYR
jgi:predicted Zn-dependent protease with MMP-like domain